MSDFQGAARLVSEALVLAALAAPVLSPALLCSASRFPAAGGCAGASLQLPVVVTQRVRGGPLGSCVSPFVACFYLLLPSKSEEPPSGASALPSVLEAHLSSGACFPSICT